MANFDDMKLAVEALSGGKNTVLLDDRGMPSIMVAFPKFKISDVIAGGSENIHPAFSVGGAEKDVVYVSKFQNIVMNDRAYSLPFKDPKTGVNFDQSVNYCRNKGTGWGLMPDSLWSAIALWCRKNGTMPRGNNNYGSDHGYPHEKRLKRTLSAENVANFETDFCSRIDILQVRKKIRFMHGAKWRQMHFGLCLRNTKMQKGMDICIRLYSPR